jgi:hypothetical protein
MVGYALKDQIKNTAIRNNLNTFGIAQGGIATARGVDGQGSVLGKVKICLYSVRSTPAQKTS